MVDLKKSEGQQIIYDLAKKSDIFLENFLSGVTDRLKVNYDKIKEINPKIIYGSITSYGDMGPY